MDENKRAKYYDDTDFSNLMRSKKGKKIGVSAKRITLNISDQIYNEAYTLDRYMRMGYQNVLKSAMTIGLTELFDHVSHHKTSIVKEPSRQYRYARKAGKLQKRHPAGHVTRLPNK
jgi:hypothetical protein